MKRAIIALIILFTGALALYVYSVSGKRSLSPSSNTKNITEEKKISVVPAESPSRLLDSHVSPPREIGKVLLVKEAAEIPSEEIIYKQKPVMKFVDKSTVGPTDEDIKGEIGQPSDVVEEVSPLTNSVKDKAGPEEKEMDRPAEKVNSVLAQKASGSVDETTSVALVVDGTTKPAGMPGIKKKEEEPAVPVEGIEQPVKEAAEIPSEEIIHKQELEMKFVDKSTVGPADEDIKGEIGQPSDVVEEVSPLTNSVKDKAGPEEKEMDRPAEKVNSVLAQKASGSVDETTSVAPVVDGTTKPAGMPGIKKKEEEPAAPVGRMDQPIVKMALVEEVPLVLEEQTGIVPAGGAVVLPIEMPAPALVQSTSGDTEEIMPGGANDDLLVKTGTSAAVSPPGEAADTEEFVPDADKAKAAVNMDRKAPSPVEMMKKGNYSRIAIFPFENLSDNRDAFKNVLPLLIDKMEKKGFEVVDEDDLTGFLCEERVRFTGYVSRELSDKIRKRFKVSAILTGAIISFSTEEIPEFGILARILDPSDDTILWADYYAATGEDFIAILELGRLKTVFSLIPKVIDILFASFKAEELNREIKHLQRIAVMPFKNNSDFNNSGIIATYMFAVEIFKSKQYIPIEYGDTRDIIIKLGIRRKGDIGYENIRELSRELNARGILIGVVDDYSDGIASSTASNVGITARLVDGSNNKILWYNNYQLSGEDNIIALDWGRIRSVHSVAYKAISGLVKEMGKKKWRD